MAGASSTQKVALVIRENGDGPETDQESCLVAAAIAAGFRFSSEQSFWDFVERLPDGSPRRVTTWSILDEVVVIDGERIGFREFQKRFQDLEWIGAHRDSTIARLHVATTGLHHLHGTLFRQPPHLLVRRGDRFCSFPPDAPEGDKREFLEMLHA